MMKAAALSVTINFEIYYNSEGFFTPVPFFKKIFFKVN